jgi:primosomal replication protein N
VANQLLLTAGVAEIGVLRYTPAGLPALDLKLDHESSIDEAGQTRQVKAALKAIAFGALAERLAKQGLGSLWLFRGFLATPRNGKHAVFHIQDFELQDGT